MTSVWVVAYYEYDDVEIEGIFSCEEKAQQYSEELRKKHKYAYFDILEYDLDSKLS